jgi:hypothetical protein
MSEAEKQKIREQQEKCRLTEEEIKQLKKELENKRE